MTNEQTITTISYVNVYREKDGGVSFGLITDTPEKAATYVYIADGVPISMLKLTFDMSAPLGKRVTASEIVQ